MTMRSLNVTTILMVRCLNLDFEWPWPWPWVTLTFLVSASRTWNILPPSVRTASSLVTFQRQLKTFLRRSSFSLTTRCLKNVPNLASCNFEEHGQHQHTFENDMHVQLCLSRHFCSRRLSVCRSVTFQYWMKTAWHIVIVSSPHGSPIILVLSASNIFTKFRRDHPLRGR